MDVQRFDALAREVGTMPNRRRLLTGTVGAALVLLGLGGVAATGVSASIGRRRCGPGRRCGKNKECVDGRCRAERKDPPKF